MSHWTDRFALTGRKALVTGASKGIGAEICAVFAEAGADIVAVARDHAGLAATATLVRAKGRECLTIAADLADTSSTQAAAAQALAQWGTIDILVNCAAITHVGPATTFPVDLWDQIMAVNLRAPFLLAQALGPGMIAQNWGKIINISSQTGVIALDDHAAYASSKGGLNALKKSLCAEWARFNVQVNAICPTVVMTPMGIQVWSDPAKGDPMKARTPARRFGEPVEVADMALYLASPASGLVNGAIMMIEGGYSSI
jgi:NAD(P)-dependent dehydrogenase (short-subunit alcohol dehydrogenase family)